MAHIFLHRLFLLLLLVVVAASAMWAAAQPSVISLHKDNFSNTSDITFVKEGAWYTGAVPTVTTADAAVWLTPDPRSKLVPYPKTANLGRIVYYRNYTPVGAFSFNTSFTFQIINNGTYDNVNACGSGITFFLSHFLQAPVNSVGGYLGLSNTTSKASSSALFFFAVEFDTALSTAFGYPLSVEPSSSHVGIDVNSLASINVTNTDNTSSPHFYPEFFLYRNSTFTSWVSYDAPSFHIRVWMVNRTVQPLPNVPTPDAVLVVQATYDLSTVLLPSVPVYVGFSGSNLADTYCSEGIALYSWALGIPA